MKKIISIFLATMLAFSIAVVPAFAIKFDDTTEYAYEAIDVLSSLNIVYGVGNNKFAPDSNITRGQICAMLTRALYPNIKTIDYNYFSDVEDSNIFVKEINIAYTHELIHGYGNGKFGPNNYITYAQMGAVMLNALDYNATNYSWPDGVIIQAYSVGLYEGIGIQNMNAYCTRADAAQIIYNAFNLKLNNSNQTFLQRLGYEKTYTKGDLGTRYLAFTDGDNVYSTSILITYELPITILSSDSYKLGNTTRVFGNEVDYYLDGVKTDTSVAAGEAIGVFDLNDNLVAIRSDESAIKSAKLTELVSQYIETKTALNAAEADYQKVAKELETLQSDASNSYYQTAVKSYDAIQVLADIVNSGTFRPKGTDYFRETHDLNSSAVGTQYIAPTLVAQLNNTISDLGDYTFLISSVAPAGDDGSVIIYYTPEDIQNKSIGDTVKVIKYDTIKTTWSLGLMNVAAAKDNYKVLSNFTLLSKEYEYDSYNSLINWSRETYITELIKSDTYKDVTTKLNEATENYSNKNKELNNILAEIDTLIKPA